MITCSIVDLEPRPALAVHGKVPVAELPEFFGRAFGAVAARMQEAGVAFAGPPFGFFPGMPADVVEVYAGFPVAEGLASEGEVEAFELPGGRAVTAMHVGPYETMEESYHQMLAWMGEQGLTPATAMWESYLSDPNDEPPEQWRTEIVWPVA